MKFDYSQHKIYSAIGYLVVQTAYIEKCIEEAHEVICSVTASKKPISEKLKDIELVVKGQTNESQFHVDETKKYFKKRDQYIHGQIYGRVGCEHVSLIHQRSGTNNDSLMVEQIDELIDQAADLLKKWQAIRLAKLT